MRSISLIVLSALMWPIGSSLAKTPPKSTPELMRWKLQRSQNILEGISKKNFKQIVKNSEELIMIGKVATWKQPDNPDFHHEEEAFIRTAKNLLAQAKAGNTQGVAYGYVRLVFNCVQCHESIRDKK